MSMQAQTMGIGTPPPIVLSRTDRDRLFDLANAAWRRAPDIAALLMGEVDRAAVVPSADLPPKTVAMQSLVTFRDDATGEERTVQIVYPQDADITKGRISVLTPIGAALIGLTEGQSIPLRTRDGRVRSLTTVAVRCVPPCGGS